MFQVILRRIVGKRAAQPRVQAAVEWIVEGSLKGSTGRGWEISKLTYDAEPVQTSQGWAYTYYVTLGRTVGKRSPDLIERQWEAIKERITLRGENVRFQPYPWKIISKEELALDTIVAPAREKEIGGDFVIDQKVLTWKDIHVPEELLGDNSDEAIANHPCFRDLYGLNAQIRTALTGIKSAAETDGRRRGHFVFHGLPACGKTSVLLAIEKLFGPGSMLRLDATSTTRAGLEKLFFDKDSENQPIPPIVICEEIEKAPEDWLKIWLGALDDRGEIRKVNFRMQQVRQLRILFFCTVNNKHAFDRMMSHDPKSGERGALSSRCVNQLYFPRPTKETIRQILLRDVRTNGGNLAWIEPAMKLAEDMNTNDPREIVSFLAGGDRLLTGQYQEDRKAIYAMERAAQ